MFSTCASTFQACDNLGYQTSEGGNDLGIDFCCHAYQVTKVFTFPCQSSFIVSPIDINIAVSKYFGNKLFCFSIAIKWIA